MLLLSCVIVQSLLVFFFVCLFVASSLQDLVIEAIYAGLIQGKLDQRNALVSVPIVMFFVLKKV